MTGQNAPATLEVFALDGGTDIDFLVLVNAWWEPVEFTLPEVRSAPQDWLAAGPEK